jgi:competence protein ComEC
MHKNRQFSPLILATIAFIFGIYAQSYEIFSALNLLIALVISSLILCFLAIEKYYSIFTSVFTCLTFISLGGFVLALQKNQHADLKQQFDGKRISIIAKVTDKQILPAEQSRDWKEIIRISVKRVSNGESSSAQKANFNLQCYLLANTSIQVDDIVEIKNVKIKVPKDQSLSQNTSYKNYLIKEDLLSSLFFYKSRCIKILYTPKLSIKRWLWNIKNNTYQRLKQKIVPTVFTYFSLMFLGNTQHKNIDSMRHTFSYWGLSHYLARSGLHIVLFILIWTFLLRLIPISIRFKRGLLILICLIYKLFSWTSLPFTRAFYAFILTEIGKIFNLQTDFLHLLSVVCLTILLFNPMQLFFLDFQLTFALTFALAFVSNYMH